MKKHLLKQFILSLAFVLFTNSYTIAQIGESLNFDGIDDKVNIGTSINAVIDPLNKFTVEAWVKTTAYTNPLGNNLGCIVGNYNTSAGGMQFLLRRDGTQFTFWVDCGSGFQMAASPVGTASLNA